MKTHTKLVSIFIMVAAFIISGCQKTSQSIEIAVFVPGIMADSPTYANLAKGVTAGVEQYNSSVAEGGSKAELYIMEAGTNQAEWSTKLTALAAEGRYSVIISSNPSLPELASPLTEQFPKQKFIMLDGSLTGNQNIACISYNQKEQTYLSGYISGLMSKTHKVAVIAAQEYPVMNTILYPYYKKGAEDAFEGTECAFRIVGNWYDAAKGSEIADALFSQGTDVILPICGGASQGVISSAKEHGGFLAFIDENSFKKAPGTVISSCSTNQERAAKEAVLDFLSGKTEWGNTRIVGLSDDYITFIEDDELYIKTVPENVRKTMSALVQSLKDGSRVLP